VALWAIPGSKLDLYAERIAVFAKANAALTTFQVRHKDVDDGKGPTIKESLAAMASRNYVEPRKT
jgi:hypothetical protein